MAERIAREGRRQPNDVRRALAWVWFLALLAALVASNPGPRVYQLWLQDQISANAGLGASALNRLAGFIGGAVAANSRYTARSNLGIASVYTTEVDGNRISVLGLAGRFVILSQRSGNAAPSAAG